MTTRDRTGTVVGHYRILARIGGGGMGVVYRAEDLKLGRTVALKFLSEEMARDPQALERFHREAQAASALEHPGICTIHDIGEADGIPFLVMEYLEGKSLKTLVEEHPLELDQLVDLGIQVGEALEALHALGMVHRDIKPGNIFVTDRGRAKILDFGLAKLRPAGAASADAALAAGPEPSDSPPLREARDAGPPSAAPRKQTLTGLIAGTAEYMSPEQTRGEPLDARSDVFSFCVVLYEMAAGREPFSGDTSSVIRYAVQHRKPRPLRRANSALPPELERIVARGLEKDAARRYQSMAELLADLRRLRSYREPNELGEALLPPVPAVPLLAEAPRSGMRTLWIGLAVATVALLLAIAAALWDLRSRALAPATVRSLAVLPLENVSGDAGLEFLSDGMAESIAESLARIGGISVAARRSAFLFREGYQAPGEAARALGTESVLRGRLAIHGDELDLSLELVEARHSAPLWSGQYHSPRSQLHHLPGEIAHSIAQGLRLSISPGESMRLSQAAPASSAALELYMQGRYLCALPTRANLERADAILEQAARADPDYAPVDAARAALWLEMQDLEFALTADVLSRVRPLVDHALHLDPRLAPARLAQANLRYRLEWDWTQAGDEFQKAVALDPADGTAHFAYAQYLGFLGRYDDSMAEIAVALRLEPLDARVRAGQGWLLLRNREYAGAEAAFRKALALDPASEPAHRGLASTLESRGDCRQGAAERIRGWQTAGRGELADAARNGLEAAGCRGFAQKALDVLLRTPENAGLHPVAVAALYLESGAGGKALDWLERAWQVRACRLLDISGEPAFDVLRADPRFVNLLQRMKPPE